VAAAGARARILAPLAVRDFALIWSASAISKLGDGLSLVAVAWATYSISNTPTALSVVGLTITIPQLLMLLFSGALSDRLPRRRLMVLADALRATTMLVLGVLALTHSLTLPAIAGLMAVYSIGTALFQPASFSLIPQVVPPELRARANGMMRLASSLAVRLVGPALGGVIVGTLGAGVAFVLDAVSFLVSLSLLLLVASHPLPQRIAKGVWDDVKDGLRFVRGQRWLVGSLGASSIGLLCYQGPSVILLPFLVKNDLGGSAADYGLVLAAGGAAAVVASAAVSQFGLPRRRMRLMYLFWSLLASCLILYAVAASIPQLALICFLAIGSMVAGDIIWATLLQDSVPAEIMGRVSSLDTLVSFSLVPLSMALTGPVAAAVGARTTLLVAGIVCVSCMVGTFLSVASIRTFDAAPGAFP